jgi:hypothetical protein
MKASGKYFQSSALPTELSCHHPEKIAFYEVFHTSVFTKHPENKTQRQLVHRWQMEIVSEISKPTAIRR